MKYNIVVNSITGKEYTFRVREEVAEEFKNFVDGKTSLQFYTFYAGKNFVMLSRRQIEYVEFMEVTSND